MGLCSLDLNNGSLGEEEQGRGNADKRASSLESRKDWNIRTCNIADPANVINRVWGGSVEVEVCVCV